MNIREKKKEWLLLALFLIPVMCQVLARCIEPVSGQEGSDHIIIFHTDGDLNCSDLDMHMIAPGTSGSLRVHIYNAGNRDLTVHYQIALDDLGKMIPLVFEYDGRYYSDFFSRGSSVNSRPLNASADGPQITIDNTLSDMTGRNDLTVHQSADLSIDWFWAFEGGSRSEQTDAIDTAIGKSKAKGAANKKITVTLTATAEQAVK